MGENPEATTAKGIVMTVDEYFRLMGNLIVNLQSLEWALRAFLYNADSKPKDPGFSKNIYDFKVGDCVEENAFTNFDTLGQLVDKYNGIVGSKDSTLCVDRGIVDIRDALAHGRIASESPSPNKPQKLVKYTKPKDGKVYVTHYITMTEDWFNKHIKLVFENTLRVQKANK